jgi:hypothetical protein
MFWAVPVKKSVMKLAVVADDGALVPAPAKTT